MDSSYLQKSTCKCMFIKNKVLHLSKIYIVLYLLKNIFLKPSWLPKKFDCPNNDEYLNFFIVKITYDH